MGTEDHRPNFLDGSCREAGMVCWRVFPASSIRVQGVSYSAVSCLVLKRVNIVAFLAKGMRVLIAYVFPSLPAFHTRHDRVVHDIVAPSTLHVIQFIPVRKASDFATQTEPG